MKVKQHVRAGVFRELAAADEAVGGLVAAGVPKADIQVVCPHCDEHHFAGCREVAPSGARAPRALEIGGGVGTLLGAGLGIGIHLAAGSGSGDWLPIAAAAAAGAVVGGFVGAMASRAREPGIADFYDQAVDEGSILVAVTTSEVGDPRDADAERIFARTASEAVALPAG